jgi:hypothetical protein
VTSWVGNGSVVVGDRADPKAWGSHVLRNAGEHTGNVGRASRETASGVRIDLRAARLGGGVAGASSKSWRFESSGKIRDAKIMWR